MKQVSFHGEHLQLTREITANSGRTASPSTTSWRTWPAAPKRT